jgi:hypothetical protein
MWNLVLMHIKEKMRFRSFYGSEYLECDLVLIVFSLARVVD